MVRLLILLAALSTLSAQPGPFDGESFHGRIAWSADGNHNDEDDWAASPVALAIFASFGVQSRLVHFDYNSILNNNNSEWEKIHEESVLGAARRFSYDSTVFHSDQRNLDAAIASLVLAINASSADDPLYLVIAGPMEVAYRAIQQARPDRLRYVYVISHSNWNDGFANDYSYNFTKRDVIATGVKWVQIRDQNRFLSTSRFGRPAQPEEWQPFHWLRDATDENLRFLWQRLRVTTRADCSDAGMAYFLMTGDEDSEIAKVQALLEHGRIPKPFDPRESVRLEAENALTLDNLEIDFDRAYRDVSHRMNVRLAQPGAGRLAIRLEQPYTARAASYDITMRYFDEGGGGAQFQLYVDGAKRGEPWGAAQNEGSWKSHTISDVEVATGSELALEIRNGATGQGRVDYVELRRRTTEALP